MANAFDNGGEPDGMRRDYEAGSNRERHYPSKSMQAYYDFREEDDEPAEESVTPPTAA